jgi:hypothetical protein
VKQSCSPTQPDGRREYPPSELRFYGKAHLMSAAQDGGFRRLVGIHMIESGGEGPLVLDRRSIDRGDHVVERWP